MSILNRFKESLINTTDVLGSKVDLGREGMADTVSSILKYTNGKMNGYRNIAALAALSILSANADINAQSVPCDVRGFPTHIEQGDDRSFVNNHTKSVFVQELSWGRSSGTAPGFDLDDDHSDGVSFAKVISSGHTGRGVTGQGSMQVPLGTYQIVIKEAGNTPSCGDTVTLEVVETLAVERLGERVEQVGQDKIKLERATATEINNTGFQIEISTDGRNFSEEAFVSSKDGNSKEVQHYQIVIDIAHLDDNGRVFVRINDIDHVGKITKGKTMPLELDINKDEDFQVYPNPASDEINFDIPHTDRHSYEMKIYDMQGNEVLYASEVKAGNNFVDIRDLKSGVYFFVIKSDDPTREPITSRFIKH